MSERTLVRAAEVALALITLAAVIGMGRLFAGGGWLGPLAANAVAAHVVVGALRHRGTPLGVVAGVMALAAGLVIAWTCYWSTTTFGIPTGTTLDAVRADLDQAWSLYQDVVAPTPARTGFLVASAIALWVIAYVADWAAFRLWVPFESTLPAATLFLFTALLGTERGRGWAVAAYAGALLGFLLLHRLARQEGTSHWVAERRTAGHRSLLTAGAGLAALAVLAGAVAGPQLPGADAAGILDPHDLDGNDAPRVTLSPLVDIQSRLVEQADVEVFTVRSTARSYWRLTSLERFDGRIWSSRGSYGKAKGDLPEAVEIEAATEPVEQSFDVTALAAIWLPTAYEPRSFTGQDLDVRYDEDSATLIVSSKVPTSDGLAYQVTSTSPRLTPEDLTGTAEDLPGDLRSKYTALPEDFSPRVTELARQITADATTPYAASRALQDHLRTFTYDLTVGRGHGGDALERFLFDSQRGYCEQFAGAFAAMARAIGLPARVAVGFTPGEADPAQPDLFRVRGEHAHAWPEVYFSGAGWVAFEPTPGRGMPAAEPYTGVPEQQADSGSPSGVEVAPVPTTAPGGPTTPNTRPDDVDTRGNSNEDEAAGGEGEGDDGGGSIAERYVEEPIRRILPWVLGALVLYGVGVPLALLAHRRRRRARATSPGQRIALAWTEAMEDATLVGFRERPSDTYAERADRLGDLLPTAIASAQALARSRELADYSPDGAGEAEVARADEAAADIAAVTRELAPRSARVRRWLDPRPGVAAWRGDRAAQVRHIDTITTGAHDHEGDGLLTGVGVGGVEVGGRPDPDGD